MTPAPLRIRSLAVALLLLATTGVHADIATTRHNLGISRTDRTQAMCAFCHTPGGGGDAAAAAVPKWQRVPPEGVSFPIYDDIGRGGRDGFGVVGSQSLACLSCHDASQAADVSQVRSRDHPFSVRYRGEAPGVIAPEMRNESPIAARTRRLRDAREYRPAVRGTVDGAAAYWVPGRFSAGIDRNALDLPLYPSGPPELPDAVMIECTTCHNPHAATRAFLRTPGGEVTPLCQTCHIL